MCDEILRVIRPFNHIYFFSAELLDHRRYPHAFLAHEGSYWVYASLM